MWAGLEGSWVPKRREKIKAFLIIFLQIYFSFSNSSKILILISISFSFCLLEKKKKKRNMNQGKDTGSILLCQWPTLNTQIPKGSLSPFFIVLSLTSLLFWRKDKKTKWIDCIFQEIHWALFFFLLLLVHSNSQLRPFYSYFKAE